METALRRVLIYSLKKFLLHNLYFTRPTYENFASNFFIIFLDNTFHRSVYIFYSDLDRNMQYKDILMV